MRGGRYGFVAGGAVLGLAVGLGVCAISAGAARAQTAPSAILASNSVPSPLVPSPNVQSPIVQSGGAAGPASSGNGAPQSLTGSGPTPLAPTPVAPSAPSATAAPASGATAPVLSETLPPPASPGANGVPAQSTAATANPPTPATAPVAGTTGAAPQTASGSNQNGPSSSLADDVPTAPDKDLTMNTAILGGLNKITAQVATIVAPVGKPVHFGTLEIIARACRKHPPEESPESGAFLDIWELRPGHAATSAFRGWMFSSSPAVSAMENPIYDIWVRDCRNTVADSQP